MSRPPDDHELLAYLDYWRQLSTVERARIIKGSRPEWPDRRVARLSGVSVRTLYRDELYCRFKALVEARPPVNAKWRGRLRRPIDPPDGGRGFCNPDDPDA